MLGPVEQPFMSGGGNSIVVLSPRRLETIERFPPFERRTLDIDCLPCQIPLPSVTFPYFFSLCQQMPLLRSQGKLLQTALPRPMNSYSFQTPGTGFRLSLHCRGTRTGVQAFDWVLGSSGWGFCVGDLFSFWGAIVFAGREVFDTLVPLNRLSLLFLGFLQFRFSVRRLFNLFFFPPQGP